MEKNYKQLSEERTIIQTQLSIGFKLGQITQELGCSASAASDARGLFEQQYVRVVLKSLIARTAAIVHVQPLGSKSEGELLREHSYRA